MQKQKQRLKGMLSKPMAVELKQWVTQRYRILEQMVTGESKEEL